MKLLLSLVIFLATPSHSFMANISMNQAPAAEGGGECDAGSKSDFTEGSQSWDVPAGCTSITIDIRGGGGGGGGAGDNNFEGGGCGGGFSSGSNCDASINGTGSGQDTQIKRGAGVLAQAATGKGGINGWEIYEEGTVGPKGSNVYSGLTLNVGSGNAGGAGYSGCSFSGFSGSAGDKVSGTLTVTAGETLTVIVGSAGGGGENSSFCSAGNGSSGSIGSVSITW